MLCLNLHSNLCGYERIKVDRGFRRFDRDNKCITWPVDRSAATLRGDATTMRQGNRDKAPVSEFSGGAIPYVGMK